MPAIPWEKSGLMPWFWKLLDKEPERGWAVLALPSVLPQTPWLPRGLSTWERAYIPRASTPGGTWAHVRGAVAHFSGYLCTHLGGHCSFFPARAGASAWGPLPTRCQPHLLPRPASVGFRQGTSFTVKWGLQFLAAPLRWRRPTHVTERGSASSPLGREHPAQGSVSRAYTTGHKLLPKLVTAVSNGEDCPCAQELPEDPDF